MATYKKIQTSKGNKWAVKGFLGLLGKKRIYAQKRGFETKTEAKYWFTSQSVAFKNGEGKYSTPQGESHTVESILQLWLPSYEPTVEPSTYVKTVEALRLHVLPKWGKVPINSIEPIELQIYVNNLQLELVRYKRPITYFKKVMDYAVTLNLVEESPFNHINLPSERRTAPTRKIWNTEEFKTFLRILETEIKSTNPLKYALLRTIAMTGIRRGEALALKWCDIDLNLGNLYVVRAYGQSEHGTMYLKEPKSEAGKRQISLDTGTLFALQWWNQLSAHTSQNDLVFTFNGTPLSICRPNKWLHDIEDTFDLPFKLSLHKLRHTVGSMVLESGGNIKQVQELLGHSDIRTTLDVYTHLTEKAKMRTTQQLSDFLAL